MTKRERLARTRGAAPTTAAHAIDLDGIDIRGARVYAIHLPARFDLSAATCRCPGPHPHPIPRCWTPTS